MASISGGNIINYDYLLRNCYSSNRLARKSSGRTSLSDTELLSADSNALRKLTKNLQDISYDKENGKNIYNNAKALIETYNNTLGSASKLSDAALEREMKKVKQFVKDHQDELKSVGIKITSTGKMEIDKEKMLETSPDKMKKILSGDGEISKTLNKYAKKLNSISARLVREEAAKKNAAEELENLSVGNNAASSNSIDYWA